MPSFEEIEFSTSNARQILKMRQCIRCNGKINEKRHTTEKWTHRQTKNEKECRRYAHEITLLLPDDIRFIILLSEMHSHNFHVSSLALPHHRPFRRRVGERVSSFCAICRLRCYFHRHFSYNIKLLTLDYSISCGWKRTPATPDHAHLLAFNDFARKKTLGQMKFDDANELIWCVIKEARCNLNSASDQRPIDVQNFSRAFHFARNSDKELHHPFKVKAMARC